MGRGTGVVIKRDKKVRKSAASKMNSLFLKLVQPFPIKEPLEIREDELSEIKRMSIKHNLFPLINTQLRKHQHIISPRDSINEFLKKSEGLFLKSITVSVLQEAIEKELHRLLKGKGIPSIVIKGNQIAKEIYDDPNCRISSDIDVLIRREDAEYVDSILAGAGYISQIDMPLKYCSFRIHHAMYNHPYNNMLIEIHWGFGVPYFFKLDSQEIWREVGFSNSGDASLSPGMIILMLLIHHHSHSFREMKILVDILWALYRYEDIIDWKIFVAELKRIGLMKTTLITLHQIQSLWKETANEMKSVPALDGEMINMGDKTQEFLLSYFRIGVDDDNVSNVYKDKLVARFALDRWSTTALSYFKTLFPVPDAIKGLYNDKRNWTLPVNYLKFIRWRMKEWMGV